MEGHVKIYRKYIVVYMVQGLILIAGLFVLLLIKGTNATPLAEVDKSLNVIRIVFFVLSALTLGAIILLKQRLVMNVEQIQGEAEKAETLKSKGTLLNMLAYIPAVFGVVMMFMNDSFKLSRIFFFVAILLFYFAFFRYTRWCEVLGIVRLGNLKR